MINKTTIDRIFEATDIVEVIGEFVQLKKRGANYVGLSPFANEKTPSFTVSPVKGIFKDFSTGLGGSAVTFLMEHEKFTYPEALKWLAKKYNIEVEEDRQTPENIEEDNRRESLMVVTAFAAKFFQQSLLETPEGQNIGLSYFKERGFREDIIRKFELGYSPDNWDAFSTAAIKQNYQQEFLLESGLSVKRDNGSLYDRYRGRVMFPIHSFTGRVVGFGGRTLKNDKSVPKYVNSPESEIYHKSNLLYGLYFAKKAIRESDNCYLVEGYADVISVHQAGIENVVASSGTSLTVEQIRLIGRSTKNITILYDGDAAGIKAALRGLDLILEEGLNVKVVTFPDRHDPDSFVRKVGTAAFKTYIDQHQKDFILYKTGALLSEAKNDPIKKAEVIREVVESIAKIPDSIKASVFVKECSSLLQMDERSLLTELNKMRQAKAKKQDQKVISKQVESIEQYEETTFEIKSIQNAESQEMQIVRLLLMYGGRMIDWEGFANTYIGPFIITELSDVEFLYPPTKSYVEIYKAEIENGVLPNERFSIQHDDRIIADLAVSLLMEKYNLSELWYENLKIQVKGETDDMKAAIIRPIFHLKRRKVDQILSEILLRLQNERDVSEQETLQIQYMQMKKVESNIANYLGIVVLK